MSKKSESGQFDVVAQAEAVVDAYIERYFSFETPYRKAQGDKKEPHCTKPVEIERRLIMLAVGGCILLAGLLACMLYFF